MSSEVIPILVPEMPLQDMHMWSGYDDDTDWNLSETINYLGVHHKKTLRKSVKTSEIDWAPVYLYE